VPVDHYYDEEDGKLYIHGGLIGHRVEAVKANDKVCYTVLNQGYIPEGGWARIMRSVICFGRIEIVTDPEIVADQCRKLCYKFTDDSEYIEAEIKKSLRGTLLMAMTIDHMSGKQCEES
jgi:nitroimidazol reductase NimA-like FMN-containing flavoprotein (pyridoxamine 5'-phosphate oxidase superfamily)